MGDPTTGFLGRGWTFPVGLAANGRIDMSSEADDVRQSIRIILGTDKGERVMRPDFGADLSRLAFEPLTTTTMSLARHYVEEALTIWEPRIDSVEVTTEPDAGMGRIVLTIHYRVRSSNTFYNLVYPFYLLEAGAEASS